ncbi:MAG: hypothetical protein NC084_09785 [Bacteroides sp.]|nr:hypothetical protein [Eubacterium sp.]MCM1419425.1 hypothetical protein [Roseburia sp.]MCM1462988.1 hypothetical protein [Bacteroides sp.]
MSLKKKKHILIRYLRSHDRLPKGALSIDADTATVGNVFVNGTWIGTFDYEERRFIAEAE